VNQPELGEVRGGEAELLRGVKDDVARLHLQLPIASLHPR
jgi:hypothetical protein